MISKEHCRLAGDADIEIAARLVMEVFDEHVSPCCSEGGRAQFRQLAEPAAFRERHSRNHLTLVAETGRQVIGVLHLRMWSHIFFLFVHTAHQRQGVAKALISTTSRLALQQDASVSHLTVNSSPNAVTAYHQLGFVRTGPEQNIDGIPFVPMSLDLQRPGNTKRGRAIQPGEG